MGGGASAQERRVYCHQCGSRTQPAQEDDVIRCGNCGSTEDVECTDTRLPVTQTTHADAPQATPRPAEDVVRVQSITAIAENRPEEGTMIFRVIPNTTYRSRTARDDVEPETARPACSELIAGLQAQRVPEDAVAACGPCVICSGEISLTMDVVELPCSHIFHRDCICEWLRRQHTCPYCRFELEQDNAQYFRSLGMVDKAQEAEAVERERRETERQKQAIERCRWIHCLRIGEPVHFGLSCVGCETTPLMGNCFRCQMCDSFVICGDCYQVRDTLTVSGQPSHMPDHLLLPLQTGLGAPSPLGHGQSNSMLSFAIPMPAAPADQSGSEGDAASAAVEAAILALRSIAMGPSGGSEGD